MKTLFGNMTVSKSLKALAVSSLAVIASFSLNTQAGTSLAAVAVVQDIQPEYPTSALRREASGYVVVMFDVAANGKAHNVKVIESDPDHMFDAAAIRAVRQSRFEVTGDSAEATGVERKYIFNHENSVTDRSFSMN